MWLLSLSLKHLIRHGTLTVIDASELGHVFGDGKAPSATIRLHNRRVATLLAVNPELYFGEAYMSGALTVENGDLYGLMHLIDLNRGWHHGHRGYEMLAKVRRLWRLAAQFNPIGRAYKNVAHHYDLSTKLYENFLDHDLQYSCGYFLHPDDDIEAAQYQKKVHIAAKLRLRPGQRVLDIGCGWGGLARYLSEACGADVTGITLSNKQMIYARQHIRPAASSGALEIRLQDYRHIGGQYDRIVSVGMFEHVGVPHYGEFLKGIYDHLADDGVALVHTIGRSEGPDCNNPWFAKYIFPGAYVPALSEIIPEIERAGLCVADIEVLRLHYAETLKAWRERFATNRDGVRQLYDERFCRMWEFYLTASEAAFRHAGHVVFQIQLVKRQDAVPLTRDYVTDWERQALNLQKTAA